MPSADDVRWVDLVLESYVVRPKLLRLLMDKARFEDLDVCEEHFEVQYSEDNCYAKVPDGWDLTPHEVKQVSETFRSAEYPESSTVMYPTNETLEREVSYLLSNQSLSDKPDIDPITVVSVDAGQSTLHAWNCKRLNISSEIDSDSPTTVEHISTADELESFYDNPSSKIFTSRLYAIHQNYAWSTLNLTGPMLWRLARQHNIMPEFLKMLRVFRWKLRNVDASYVAPFQSRVSEEQIQYAYMMKYAEHTGRRDYEPWTLRQCALYHSYDIVERRSIYILITPVAQSKAETDLVNWLQGKGKMESQLVPFRINEILWASYMDNWKPYTNFYEDQLQQLSSNLTSPNAEDSLSARPGTLHFLETRFLPVDPAFKTMTGTMTQLRELFNSQKMWRSESDRRRYDFGPFNEVVDIHVNQIASYNEHLQVLLKRCNSTAKLLEQLVASKNQKLAREQNEYILTLTKSAADDSAAIRVITVITLIYLSSTVVATIMDTPFFYLDDGRLRVSREVWIYVVIALPLTIATLMYWRWRLQKRNDRQFYTIDNVLASEKLPAERDSKFGAVTEDV